MNEPLRWIFINPRIFAGFGIIRSRFEEARVADKKKELPGEDVRTWVRLVPFVRTSYLTLIDVRIDEGLEELVNEFKHEKEVLGRDNGGGGGGESWFSASDLAVFAACTAAERHEGRLSNPVKRGNILSRSSERVNFSEVNLFFRSALVRHFCSDAGTVRRSSSIIIITLHGPWWEKYESDLTARCLSTFCLQLCTITLIASLEPIVIETHDLRWREEKKKERNYFFFVSLGYGCGVNGRNIFFRSPQLLCDTLCY